jgi:hypothetical protein
MSFSLNQLDIANPSNALVLAEEPYVTVCYGSTEHIWKISEVKGMTFTSLLTERGSLLGMEFNASKTTIRKEDVSDDDEFNTIVVGLNDEVTPGVYIVNTGVDSKG